MPASEVPTDVNEPKGPSATSPDAAGPNQGGAPQDRDSQEPALPIRSQSRWVDYDTHELLSMISDLEDERRWSRLREGIWIAILIHLAFITALVLLPKYVFKVPLVVDQNAKLKEHQDFTYLDTPRDLIPKAPVKPIEKPPVIDKQTLQDMNKTTPQPAPEPAPKASEQPAATPPPTIPPNQQSQSPIEAPRPAAVPARPNFAMGNQNPNDQLRDAMKGASHNPGMGAGQLPGHGGLSMHPGAGTGGIEVLSDTQGVDFNGWLQRWHRETERTWDPLIPDEVNPPILKAGMVAIRFKVLPNGRIMDGSMTLDGRSGDVALDRAAWGALTGSNYPPLPHDFHGPYLELRAYFMYNMEPPR